MNSAALTSIMAMNYICFTTTHITEYGATLEAKPVSAYNGDLWDPNDPDYLQRH